jgi:hypothetical protein
MSWETYGAAGDFVCLAVIVLIIGGLSVATHSHDVGEHGAGAVVLVCVEEDTKTLEFVRVAEDVAWLRALLGEPHGEAVAIEIPLAMDLKLEKNLLA